MTFRKKTSKKIILFLAVLVFNSYSCGKIKLWLAHDSAEIKPSPPIEEATEKVADPVIIEKIPRAAVNAQKVTNKPAIENDIKVEEKEVEIDLTLEETEHPSTVSVPPAKEKESTHPRQLPATIEDILDDVDSSSVPPVEIEIPAEKDHFVSSNPSTHIINIASAATVFAPDSVVIKLGDTVKWTNNDMTIDAHLFQSVPGSNLYNKELDEIPLTTLYGGKVVEHTFNQIGVYPYFCFIHRGMKGRITVVKEGQSIESMKREVKFLTKRKKRNINGSRKKLLAKEMILIKEGNFIMGTPNEPSEAPPHVVYLPDFSIDKYEVTNEEYEEFVDASDYKSEGEWRKKYIKGSEKYPVVNVSYNDAVAYAKWAKKRLPTEAEWEKAARGSDKRLMPWGDDMDNEMANVFGPDDYVETAPVGTFEEDVSPYGVYDMAGNVSEWTSDKYLPYEESPMPEYGNFSPKKQVIRGGSYSSVDMEQTRTHSRTGKKPANSSISVGFRLVNRLVGN